MKSRPSMWWNPFTTERVQLRTPLSPDECTRRIRANVYSPWSGTWNGVDPPPPFFGQVRGGRFTLAKNTPHFRNAFRPFAKGVMRADAANGAIVSVHMSLHIAVRIWCSVILIGLLGALLLSLASAAGIVKTNADLSNPTLVLFSDALILCLFYPFYLIGFWALRGERAFLVETLQRILEAPGAEPQRPE